MARSRLGRAGMDPSKSKSVQSSSRGPERPGQQDLERHPPGSRNSSPLASASDPTGRSSGGHCSSLSGTPCASRSSRTPLLALVSTAVMPSWRRSLEVRDEGAVRHDWGDPKAAAQRGRHEAGAKRRQRFISDLWPRSPFSVLTASPRTSVVQHVCCAPPAQHAQRSGARGVQPSDVSEVDDEELGRGGERGKHLGVGWGGGGSVLRELAAPGVQAACWSSCRGRTGRPRQQGRQAPQVACPPQHGGRLRAAPSGQGQVGKGRRRQLLGMALREETEEVRSSRCRCARAL
jgi:hypothetical protein